MGKTRCKQGFGGGNLIERDQLEEPDEDGRIILNGYSGSRMWGHELDRTGSGEGQVAGTCECCNEPAGSIKCGEFRD
jgi:hypothetical protein